MIRLRSLVWKLRRGIALDNYLRGDRRFSKMISNKLSIGWPWGARSTKNRIHQTFYLTKILPPFFSSSSHGTPQHTWSVVQWPKNDDDKKTGIDFWRDKNFVYPFFCQSRARSNLLWPKSIPCFLKLSHFPKLRSPNIQWRFGNICTTFS